MRRKPSDRARAARVTQRQAWQHSPPTPPPALAPGLAPARLAGALLGLLAAGCAAPMAVKDQAFVAAVESVQEGEHVAGARLAWEFLSSADRDDPRYDRGLRLLGRAFEELRITWAAGMLYRQIAQARHNMELVPEAIAGVERIVSAGDYDEDTLLTSFIAAEEFSDLPRELQAFVDFHKGLDMTRRFLDAWAAEHFGRIPEDSPYAAEAAYVRAVREVADGDYGAAVTRLTELAGRADLPARLRRDIERSLARVAFEEERYEDALAHFTTLKGLAPDDPEILLELAWTHYYLGDSRKALGLLLALDAPVHQTYIAPERYLLEALALRRLCQFGAARHAAIRLEQKYGDALHALAAGTLPADIAPLRNAARLRGRTRANSLFMFGLRAELGRVEALAGELGPGLVDHLRGLYARGLAEVARRERALIDDDLDDLTEELLAAREGVALIVHELSVALLRGQRRPAGATELPAIEVSITGRHAFYPFNGEYWTDELDDLLVVAEDRCIDLQ